MKVQCIRGVQWYAVLYLTLAVCMSGASVDSVHVCPADQGGADVNLETSRGTPLTTACSQGYVETVNLLLVSSTPHKCSNTHTTVYTQTHTHTHIQQTTATSCSSLDTCMCACLCILTQSHGANVNHETRDGLTALMVAVREDRREVVRLLLQNGADPHHASRDSGKTALDIAQEKVGTVGWAPCLAVWHTSEDRQPRQRHPCRRVHTTLLCAHRSVRSW